MDINLEVKVFKELFALKRYLKTIPIDDKRIRILDYLIGKKFVELATKGVSPLELLDMKPLDEALAEIHLRMGQT